MCHLIDGCKYIEWMASIETSGSLEVDWLWFLHASGFPQGIDYKIPWFSPDIPEAHS